jgi:hypothetical protein
MKLPDLFNRNRTSIVHPDAQDRAERILAESFRLLGQLCGKVADLIETQRLSRAGYEDPQRYVERIESKNATPPTKP